MFRIGTGPANQRARLSPPADPRPAVPRQSDRPPGAPSAPRGLSREGSRDEHGRAPPTISPAAPAARRP
ncbi:MAG: hypothetical protein LBE67_09985 [Kocuria palustris]|nr:hypothetical protein [Kocuria palustris]